MKRKIFGLLLAAMLLVSGKAYTQVFIMGPSPVNTDDVVTYTADLSYDPCHYGYINLSWVVTGGIILTQNVNPGFGPVYCQVRWTASTGFAASVKLYGDNAPAPPGFPSYCFSGNPHLLQTMDVTIGKVSITPLNQTVPWYGANATPICVSIPGVTIFSYQWQETTDLFGTWTNTGTNSSCLQVNNVTENKYYQCELSTSAGIFYSPIAFVGYAEFSAGQIWSPNATLPYNSVLNIQQLPATGGYCSGNYQYIWEQSVEDGPWMQVSTNVDYPAGQNLVGKIAIRRRVKCDINEMVTNTVVVTATYTTSDFENRTYIRETTIQKRGISSWFQADAQAIGDKLQVTTYLDGLGRKIQTVDKGVSPTTGGGWKDLVIHYEYDEAGRVVKDFLPYATTDNAGKFKTNAASDQSSYIRSFFGEPANAPTHSIYELESSPISRLRKSMAAGAGWAGANKGNTLADDFNRQVEDVRIWTLDYSPGAIPVNSLPAIYPTGKLSKKEITDENDNKVITYTDYSGNVILKKVTEYYNGQSVGHTGWACTYYVYDDFDRLRYTIPPKAVAWLTENNWNLTQTIIDELCFKYDYDEKSRVIIKKQPGVGEEKMVYDKKNRVVLMQHANQDKANNTALTKNQWLFVLYDDLNNVIAKGLLENDNTRTDLQVYVNQLSNSIVNISAFVGSGNHSFKADNPVAGSSGTSGYLPGTSGIIFNSLAHFDNYNYIGAKAFSTNYTLAYSGAAPNIEPTVVTQRTVGMLTGQKIRICDNDNNYLNDNFQFSTIYYDEEGRVLESLGDNVKLYNGSGMDYKVNQYDFTGKVMSQFISHKPDVTNTISIIAKNEYDLLGRSTAVYRNFNNTFFKQLAEYSYDELGRLKTRRLAPTGPGDELELLAYTYNIRGWLSGINKDYVLSNNNYSQWDRYFGMQLAYSSSDNAFSTPQLNGNITATAWRSQGDNASRRYDYIYDPMGRINNAYFRQRKNPSDANWSNTEVDFTTSVEYEDLNGNIKSMKHMGVIPGVNTGVIVDDLQYTYLPTGVSGLSGNRLKQVDELGTLGNNNGLLGDFKDVNTTQDYYYDVNGNLLKDLNKNVKNGSANGITYNFMNKPEKIVIDNKSIIEFTYNANGEKIRKKVTYVDNSIRITTYIDAFVYEQFIPAGGGGLGEQLQFILHEEGRLKIIVPHTRTASSDYELNAGTAGISNWPGGKQGVFEYFIKDHQGSTRMVLTEEIQKEYYAASMESSPAVASVEEKLFGQVDPVTGLPTITNELQRTRLTNQSIWPGNSTDVVRLTALDPNKVLGPNMIVKVMAGDIVNCQVKYYYAGMGSSGSNPLLNNVITSFMNALSGGKANEISKIQSVVIGGSLNPNIPFGDFLQGHNQVTNRPRAFLNIVYFDEQFKFIEFDPAQSTTGSNYAPVGTNQNSAITLQQRAPKNGWAFVFLSNESDEPVYFDDLLVTHEHSPMLEENHYYPFGQKITAISSRAFNKQSNKYNFQGLFSEDEEETGWDEFALRMYDPQIGRWTGSDPYAQYASPYIGLGNNPVNGTDPDGGGFFDNNGTLIGAVAGMAAGIYLGLKNDKPGFAIMGMAIGAGLGYGIDVMLHPEKIELIEGGFVTETESGSPRLLSPFLNARFRVKNVDAESLQVIQVIHGEGYPVEEDLKFPFGKYEEEKDGKIVYSGTVDGGKHDFLNFINNRPPINEDLPYMMSEDPNSAGAKYWGRTKDRMLQWDRNKGSGTILLHDKTRMMNDTNVETIIVAKNYKNSGKDKILAHFKWGYKHPFQNLNIDPAKNPGGIELIKNNKISDIAKKILTTEFPNYRFF